VRQSTVHPRTTLCAPGEHRCVALMLGFFAIEAGGEIDDMTRAAVTRCEAQLTAPCAQGRDA
jgi:hypothetical protein